MKKIKGSHNGCEYLILKNKGWTSTYVQISREYPAFHARIDDLCHNIYIPCSDGIDNTGDGRDWEEVPACDENHVWLVWDNITTEIIDEPQPHSTNTVHDLDDEDLISIAHSAINDILAYKPKKWRRS